jgi:oligosaccharide repeat unit polymerase
MLALLYMDTKSQNDYVLTGKSFIYSTVAACTIIFLNALSYNNYSVASYFDNIIKTGQSLGNFNAYETTGVILSNNQNTIGMYCVIAIAVAFLLLQHGKMGKQEAVFSISVLTIFGLITGSRTFIIMFLFVILYYILINTKKGHLKRFIFIALGLLIIILIIQFMFPEIFQFINNRFNEKEMLGSRDKIFALYNDYMFTDAGSSVPVNSHNLLRHYHSLAKSAVV